MKGGAGTPPFECQRLKREPYNSVLRDFGRAGPELFEDTKSTVTVGPIDPRLSRPLAQPTRGGAAESGRQGAVRLRGTVQA